MESSLVMENFRVSIKYLSLNICDEIDFVKSEKCGAINTFMGTIRNIDKKANGKSEPIEAIVYEAYDEMVIKQIGILTKNLIDKCGDTNCRASVSIRLGKVLVNEVAIIICVSSTNRKVSHNATIDILEKVKSMCPIWKKVMFCDGTTEWFDVQKSEAFWLRK